MTYTDSEMNAVEALLPAPVQERLRNCPERPNKGIHPWLIATATRLNYYLGDKDIIAALLSKYSANRGRPVEESEIWGSIWSSEQWLEDQRGRPGNHERAPKWPEPDESRIEAIVRSGPTLAELSAQSPIRWTDGEPKTEEIIDVLFPGNPLLCAAADRWHSQTFSREDWRGALSEQEFIVPSPMTSQYGKNKKGKDSMRTLANTGPRRFIVVEFDSRTFDEQASIICHLANSGPLVLVVHSGGKSLHSWFFCAGQDQETVEPFFRQAVSLGADRATWTRSQLVRMPDGLREGVTRQHVVYFNPQRLEVR